MRYSRNSYGTCNITRKREEEKSYERRDGRIEKRIGD